MHSELEEKSRWLIAHHGDFLGLSCQLCRQRRCSPHLLRHFGATWGAARVLGLAQFSSASPSPSSPETMFTNRLSSEAIVSKFLSAFDSTDAQLRRWQDPVLEPLKVRLVCVLFAPRRTAFEDCFSWFGDTFSSCSHAQFAPLVRQPSSSWPIAARHACLSIDRRDRPPFCLQCASNGWGISLQVHGGVPSVLQPFSELSEWWEPVSDGNVHGCVSEVRLWTLNCFLHLLSSLALPRQLELLELAPA